MPSGETRRIAAVQLVTALGDVDANLEACAALVAQAAAAGAQLVVLPEFFTTGMAYLPSIRAGVRGPEIDAWLVARAGAHGVTLGGSYLRRDADGDVRNAFVLTDGDGVLGRHDKDRPTMWENAFYVGGDPGDDGVLATRDGLRVGVAMCWELMRRPTVERMRGRVDVVLAGSAWWSVPAWRPRAVMRRWELANRRVARGSAAAFARLVGAPVAHASHAGALRCPSFGLGVDYAGIYEGPTGLYAADGAVLTERQVEDGAGVVVADVAVGSRPPAERPAGDYWLHPRVPVARLAWHWQRVLGAREYRRNRR